MALHRAIPGGAAADEDGVLRVDFEAASGPGARGQPYPRAGTRVPRGRRRDSRVARRRRTDPRVRAVDHRRGRTGRHRRLFARPELRAEAAAARNLRRRRAAQAGAPVPARAAGRAAGAQAHPTTTSKTARRSSSANISCAVRWTPFARSLARHDGSVADEYRQKISERGHARRRCGSRPNASWTVSSGWATRTPSPAMIRTYLDWLLAVPWAKRSEERLDPVHAREVLDADHEGLDDVKRRITEYLAVRKLRTERGMTETPPFGSHPHVDRTSGHRQDLDRRVDCASHRAAVRPDVARRRARRSGNPRPSPHLHRRAAGTAGARAARRRHDESGDHAGRGRQDRRGLARRSVGGAARGARPGAEPRVPGSLSRRRAGSVARAVRRDGERRRYDSAGARSTGWK